MKKGISIILAVMVVTISLISGVSAGEYGAVSNKSELNLGTMDQFSALDGLTVEAMNDVEMDNVVGKATPIVLPKPSYFSWSYFWFRSLYSATPIVLP